MTGRAAPGRGRGLLVHRDFGPFFWGNLGSNIGTWLFQVTAAVVIFDLTASALLVGLLSVAQFGPMVVLSPWAGALSDRIDRRRLVLWAQTACAAAAFGIAVPAMLLGVERLGAWPVIAGAFGIGMGKAFSSPSLNSLVPSLVDDDKLEGAVSLLQLTFNVGRAAGPVGAGVFLVTLGPELAFTFNAASFLGLVAALLVVRVRPRGGSPSPDEDRSVRAGLRYVLADRQLLVLLLGVAAVGFASDPVITLAPAIAQELGRDAGLTAAMVSAFGIMATLCALPSGRLQRGIGSLRVAGSGTLMMSAGLLLVALAWLPALAVAGFAVTGAGFTFGVTALTSLVLRRLPDAMRGRVMAMWTIAFLGTRPLAASVHGATADLVGPRAGVLVALSVALAGTWLAFSLSRREPPTTAAGPRLTSAPGGNYFRLK